MYCYQDIFIRFFLNMEIYSAFLYAEHRIYSLLIPGNNIPQGNISYINKFPISHKPLVDFLEI